jgi:hypothetical protein
MKFTVSAILMMLLSFAACLYLPWWSIAIVCFLVSVLIRQRPGIAFLCGFTALFILWVGMSTWLSAANGHVLANKLSGVFKLPENSGNYLILLTGAIGALVGGLGALTGSLARPKPTN